MAPTNDDGGLYRAVGKIEGQLRELIHGQNNQSQKLDAIAREVAVNSEIPARVAELDTRVTALETDKNKRDGAMGFGGWLLKNRLVEYVIWGAIVVWTYLHGKGGQ